MFKFFTHAMWALLFAALLNMPAAAQMPISTGGASAPEEVQINPEEMTPEAIDSMVARMSDDQVRALLLERLDAVAASPQSDEPRATISERLQKLWTAFTFPISDMIQKLPVTWQMQKTAFANQAEKLKDQGGILTMLGLTALVLAIGLAVEMGVRTYIRRTRDLDAVAGTAGDETSLRSALSFLVRRFLREIVGLIVFFVVIRTVGRAILSPEQLAFVAPLVLNLIWMPRIAAAFSRVLLAPKRPDLRLVSIDDRWAGFLQRHIVGVFFLGGLTIFAVTFNQNNGVPPGSTRLGYMLDTMVYIYIAIIAWTAREGLRDMMLGTDPDRTEFDVKVSNAFPFYAIAVAVCTWALVATLLGLGKGAALLHGAHYTSMALLLAVPVIDTAIRGLVRHAVPPMTGEGPAAETAYRSTKRSLVRIGRVLSVGIVLALIARAWDFTVLGLMQGREGIADNIFSFVMTVVVGYVVYEGVSLWINSRLAAEMTALGMSQEDADAEMGGASGSRLSTVLPLALLSARTAIIVVFGLLAVGNLGIDITPLLAGAGIAGLAIGFGAQKLVSDVVSGVFFLVDDAFRVGEYVEIAGTMGAVEKISIRSMQLRHHRGAVHTIPYGEIPQLTNYSRDWVIMKLKFTVPFDTDPNKVKKIFKKIGQEMLEDELYKDDFLQPFKSQGVFDIDDVGMVIRGKFMAKPGKQFMIRKEIYNKIKAAFEEAGIDFARREVRVAIPGMEHHEDMTEEEKAQMAAAGAAASAAQQQGQVPGGGGSKPGD